MALGARGAEGITWKTVPVPKPGICMAYAWNMNVICMVYVCNVHVYMYITPKHAVFIFGEAARWCQIMSDTNRHPNYTSFWSYLFGKKERTVGGRGFEILCRGTLRFLAPKWPRIRLVRYSVCDPRPPSFNVLSY